MRKRGALLLLIGLLLVIGHPLHAVHFSGRRVEHLALQEGASWSVSALTMPRASAMRAVQIRLDPPMNPVRLIVSADVSGPANAVTRYDAVAVGPDGAIAWRGQVQFSTGKTGGAHDATVVLQTFDVREAGEWGFALLPTGQRTANVSGLALEVRRNVGGVSKLVIGLGVLCSLWGTLLYVRTRRHVRAPWRTTHAEPA